MNTPKNVTWTGSKKGKPQYGNAGFGGSTAYGMNGLNPTSMDGSYGSGLGSMGFQGA